MPHGPQTLDAQSVGYGLAYFLLCIVITGLLMVPVARSTFVVNQGEGFFRFRHARLKEFAECVAFYSGQQQERAAADGVFESLYWKMRTLFKRTFFLSAFVTFQASAVNAFSLLVVTGVIIASGSINGQPVTVANSGVPCVRIVHMEG